MALKISNRDARRLWLERQGLALAPLGPLDQHGLAEIIHKMGFVQLDTIRIIARAHDHILWSRNHNYRPAMMDDLMRERLVFEHFTHDASVLPMEFYPYWRRQFDRMREKVTNSRWGEFMPPKRERDKVYERICAEGPLCTKDFESKKPSKSKHAWARPPHKFVLDGLWYAGELATCHREKFIKFYDTREKIIPAKVLSKNVSDARQLNWLCENALERMGFGTEGDIQRFWDAADLAEVKSWRERNSKKLVAVEITGADKSVQSAWAPADIEDSLAKLKAPTSRLRILNPFDPVIRDRNRLQRLFGFDYRIEIFIPAAKRQYGYYVYPLLEGDRFVGRLEARADKKGNVLTVDNLWWEKGVKPTEARLKKLEGELARIAKLGDVDEVEWRCSPA